MIKEFKKMALMLCLVQGTAKAQDSVKYSFTQPTNDIMAIGAGTGLDYGGTIGLRLLAQPAPNFGVFMSGGLWYGKLSANAGLKIRMLKRPQSTASPYLMAMYGNNEAIVHDIYNASGFRGLGKGVSAGAGIDLFNTPKSPVYLTLGANFAIAPALLYFTAGLNIIMVRGR